MAAEPEPDFKLEIAHVLTIDIVAYSTLLINEQSRVMTELNKAVRNTPCFRRAEEEGRLTRLPTGDGMALVFFGDPEAPLECAMQISTSLKDEPDIRLRMGVHSGPINQVLDVNDRANVAGAGIDVAQRVMDCGDAGHILVSKRVADDLAPYSRWNRHLHDIGECEVKHGRKVALYNFYSDSVGNPAVPEKLKGRGNAAGRPARWSGRKRAMLLAGLALLALTATIVFGSRGGRPPTVAVLSFVDLSQARDQEYLGAGIAEQIINSLGKTPGIAVLSRSSSFAFKNMNPDVRALAKLGVTHVVEGSVNRAGGRVRVGAHLVEVRTGFRLWGDTYDSTEQDALSLQSEVAKKVAHALERKLQLVAEAPTENTEAYDLYLRGRYQLNKRTVESVNLGRDFFAQAIAKDPRFALAHAGLADAYILLGKLGASRGEEAAQRAWPEVTAALSLDPQLAEGYVSRAILLNDFNWDWDAAEADFKQAIALNPSSAAAHHWYARCLAQRGRAKEARDEIARAQKLDPLSPTIRVTKGKIHFVDGNYDKANAACREALEFDGNFASAYSLLAQSHAHRGDDGKAVDAATKYVELSGGSGWAQLELAYAHAVAGERAMAETIIGNVMAQGLPFSPYDMATICAAWRDTGGALQWLAKAIHERSVDVIWIRVDPRLENVRSDPGFQNLLETMNARRSTP